MNLTTISDLPSVPAVYAMYGGKGRGCYVAYIGIAKSLRGRIEQHLVRRDSSVATGTSAVCLNPDQITAVRWWTDAKFEGRDVLEAAELVAFDVFDPTLRSRGNITDRAKQLHADEDFCENMRAMFTGEPAGVLVIPSLAEALEQIADLRQRVGDLEERLATIEANEKP